MSSQGSDQESLGAVSQGQATSAPAPAPVSALVATATVAHHPFGFFDPDEWSEEDDLDEDMAVTTACSSSRGGSGKSSAAGGEGEEAIVALRQMPFGVILRFMHGYIRATALQRPSVSLRGETHGQHALPFKGLVRVVLNICNWPTASVRAGSMEWFRFCRDQLYSLVDKVSVLGMPAQVGELQGRIVEIHQAYNAVRIKKAEMQAMEIALIDREVAAKGEFVACVENFFIADPRQVIIELKKVLGLGATGYLKQVQDVDLKRMLCLHYPSDQALQQRLGKAGGELSLPAIFAKRIGRRGGYLSNTRFLCSTLELFMEALLSYLNKLQFVSFYPLPAAAKYPRKIKSSKDGARERAAFDAFDRFFDITNRPVQEKIKKILDEIRVWDEKIKATSAGAPAAKAAKEALRKELCNYFVRQMYFLFDFQRVRKGKYDTRKKKDQLTAQRVRTDYVVSDPDIVSLTDLTLQSILGLETDGRRSNNVGELIRVMGMYLYLFLDSYPDLVVAVGGIEAIIGVGPSDQIVTGMEFSRDIIQPFIVLVLTDWGFDQAEMQQVVMKTLQLLAYYQASAPRAAMREVLRSNEQLSSDEGVRADVASASTLVSATIFGQPGPSGGGANSRSSSSSSSATPAPAPVPVPKRKMNRM